MTNEFHVYSYLKRYNGDKTREEIKRHFPFLPEETIDRGILEYNDMAENTGIFEKMKGV